MAIAIGLFVLLAFTVIFHFVSPWWFTPIASNWGGMDDTIVLTFWVTGAVFIAITLFMIYCLIKFRHKDGIKAQYQPENKSLEVWLTVFTTVGVVVLLAPGLKVWGDYINVPDEAHIIEVIGQQWQWSYRYPGEDGQLGTAHVKHVTFDNPVGVNPDDPHGQDDIVIIGSELHIPVDQPVKVLLRSKDVLHNFYVPQFRAKMDIVPGLVSYLWFTPTKPGRYEVLCAELCGVGHYSMRSHVVVDSKEDYRNWLSERDTFGHSMSRSQQDVDPLVGRGREVAQNNGCLGCHSLDGGNMLGPTWKGLYGKMEQLADGSSVLVDDAYFIESIVDPNSKIVSGFSPVMPASTLSDDDLQALIAFARSGAVSVSAGDEQTVDEQLSIPVEENAGTDSDTSLDGRQLAQTKGCIACHTLDGKTGLGPSWKGLYGATKELADGSSIVVDAAYLSESITDPNAKVVKGFPPVMPPALLSEAEIDALITFIRDEVK